MDTLTFIVSIAILIMSIVIHELCHGYVAELLGDPTPRLQGRLTLNPLKHLDPFGSVIVPILTSFAGFTFGWAKPVQWNPYNVKNKRVGELLISIAGPGANLLIALIFGFIIRFYWNIMPQSFLYIVAYVVMINITLAIFNLIPIPPLDGSKVLFSLVPSAKYPNFRASFERYSIVLIFIFLFVIWKYVEPVIPFLFRVVTGVNF